MAMMHSLLFRLPEEISAELLQYVKLKDLVNLETSFCNRVEKNMFHKCLQRGQLNVKESVTMNQITFKNFKWMDTNRIRLNSVRIEGDFFGFETFVKKKGIFSKLKSLNLFKVNDPSLKVQLVQLISISPVLIEIKVEDVCNFSQKLLAVLLKKNKLHQLESVSLSGNFGGNLNGSLYLLTQHCSNLVTIDLQADHNQIAPVSKHLTWCKTDLCRFCL